MTGMGSHALAALLKCLARQGSCPLFGAEKAYDLAHHGSTPYALVAKQAISAPRTAHCQFGTGL